MPQPPYGVIARLLAEGQVIPFLGAGVNVSTPAIQSQSLFPPTGAALSKQLADAVNFPSSDEKDREDLAKVCSYFAETVARRELRTELRRIFHGNFEPREIHRILAANPSPLLIVTTNYDNLLERAFEEAGTPYDLVVHPTDRQDYAAAVLCWKHGAKQPEAVHPNKLNLDISSRTVIYKMHGTVHPEKPDWDSYVITEEDYVEFLSRMTGRTAVPSQFMLHFRERHFLFLGYSLRDWNFRVIHKNLKTGPNLGPSEEPDRDAQVTGGEPGADGRPTNANGVSGTVRSWAIQYKPSELEVELWGYRGVVIYDKTIDEFAAELKSRLEGRAK